MESNISKMKKALMRSNTRLLLTSVMLFQFTCMLLVSLQGDPIDLQALILAVAMPLVTAAASSLAGRLWPVDRAIAILVMLLCSVGIITLQDICRSPSTPLDQAIYALVGIVAMFVGIAFIRALRHWKKWRIPLMTLCLGALMLPWVIGRWSPGGARNWISIAGISIQPSEFVKPALIIMLATGFANRPRFVKCIPTLAFAAVCCGILLSQHDLGALLLYFLTTVIMYYAATSNLFITLCGLGMGAGCAVAAYKMFDYVQNRVAIWLDPWFDPTDKGLQIVQSLIAIGSGGLTGMGVGMGMPRNIPLYESDFIFAAIAEAFGLIFCIGLMAIYVLIIMRGMIVAMNARSSFHSLTSFGLMVMLGLQTLLIIGGNIKLIPLTGVTLPFIASGGSSLVSCFLSIGILLGISSINAEDEARDIQQLEIRETAF